LETIHVVQGCHIDVGFVKTSPQIVDLWFSTLLPRAAQVGRELERRYRGQPGKPALHFTAPSWIVSLFHRCPEIYERVERVECPTNTSAFRDSIRDGYVRWHAMPFDVQAELMDETMLRDNVALSHRLDSEFSLAPKRVMSQRDVPGLTRSALRVLASSGVRAISLGVNGGTTPPSLPKVCVWRDEASNTSMPLYTLQGGYGGIELLHHRAVTVVPGSRHAMVVAWRGDNAGPPESAEQVELLWAQLERRWPNVTILASTFEQFADATRDAVLRNAPVVRAEIGDVWIYGVASDPLKLAKLRSAQRVYSRYVEQQQSSNNADSELLFEFSRLFMLGFEHTWGLDQKVAMPDAVASNWTNAEFGALRHTEPFARMAESWLRQRRMVFDDALAVLGSGGGIELAKQIRRAFDELHVPEPPAAADDGDGGKVVRTSADDEQCFALPFDATLCFSTTNGALTRFNDVRGQFGLLVYATYDEQDYRRFEAGYNYLWPVATIDKLDQQKTNLPEAAVHRLVNATAQRIERVGAATVVVKLALQPSSLHDVAGAPSFAWLNVTLTAPTQLAMTLAVYNKTATRLPEALFARFIGSNPLLPSSFMMRKLDELVDPADIVLGGSNHLHVVDTVTLSKQFSLTPIDSPLVCFGAPTAFPTPLVEQPDFGQGVASVLHNNAWNTNYVQWYPFDHADRNILYRFEFTKL
jgi:Domain of unknown function (DUF5054)